MADYRDGASVEDDPVTALDERNDNPGTDNETEQHKFQDVDENGDADQDALHHNSDRMEMAVTDNAVQPDPDPGEDAEGPSTGVVMKSRMVYENVPSTGYVGDPIEDVMYKYAGTTYERNRINGPDGSSFAFAEANDDVTQADDATAFYDSVLAPFPDEEDDKVGQLALRPVTHLDYETKDTYVIEISDPDAQTDVSTIRVTISVLDVNEAPSAPSELKGLPPALNTAPEFRDAKR